MLVEAVRSNPEHGFLDEIFRGLAEYDYFAMRVPQLPDPLEAWAKAHDNDPDDDEVLDVWDSLHAVWMVAWDFFGWDGFQSRLAAARSQLQLNEEDAMSKAKVDPRRFRHYSGAL